MSFLRLVETLTAFLQRLRASADSLDIIERQKVVRLLVKEVLVDNDSDAGGEHARVEYAHDASRNPTGW
ncbi:hypothetical protein QA648_35940 (plasmid) [Rhizobium sp. CB3171]|uniref:hypothetical protein n=1 Tax=Rhizobium sp. CB3171 TaxID=3039157 RepID=UPI0024B145C4|nr:hypothetical protein [Rhizobium sp. CB3171]WFU07296.1 hypothetical protein QA648_35940 [Rhizobium sp. CB3171]